MSLFNSIISNATNPQSIAQEAQDLTVSENINSITAVPSHLLQRAIQVCDTKTELVVYLTIIRFSLGFNRDSCTLSRRFIASWTGLHFANVGRGVEGLVAKGLIQRLPSSNSKYGELFKLSLFQHSTSSQKQECSHSDNTPTVVNLNTKCSQFDNTKQHDCSHSDNTPTVVTLNTERSHFDNEALSNRLRSVVSLITKNKEEDEKESSSSKKLQSYFDSLKEPHCLKIERKSFFELSKNFSPEQIELALEHTQKHGTTAGDAVKLPLKYLSTGSSMTNLLGSAEKQKLAHEAKAQREQAILQTKLLEEEKQKQAQELESQSTIAFEKAFPTPSDQETYIAEFLKKSFLGKHSPKPNLARKLAIVHWFKRERLAK